MGEEPGEKGFLGLEISEGPEGESGAKSGHEPAPCSVQPLGHISVTSMSEEADGSQARSPAPWRSLSTGWDGELGGLISSRSQLCNGFFLKKENLLFQASDSKHPF